MKPVYLYLLENNIPVGLLDKCLKTGTSRFQIWIKYFFLKVQLKQFYNPKGLIIPHSLNMTNKSGAS